ncbi:hypothetical protein DY000_02029382 [Brassica cretica]|uniref:Uncharacterized protein n=1 Tax=Brassica cretica TaxID=69181 RepID=A0ABQ7DJ79_BRACR|nr:hypothetical protein DY000_02029382 [Brassica cretica]
MRSYAPAAAFSNPDPVPPPKRFLCLSPFPAVEAAVSLDMLSFRLPERLGHNIITLNLSANPSPICLNNVRTGTNISKRIVQNLIFVFSKETCKCIRVYIPKQCMEREKKMYGKREEGFWEPVKGSRGIMASGQ